MSQLQNTEEASLNKEDSLFFRAITRNPEEQDFDSIATEYWRNMLDLQKVIKEEMPNAISTHEQFIAYMQRCYTVATSGTEGGRRYSGVTGVEITTTSSFRSEHTSMGGLNLAQNAINGIDPVLHEQFLADPPNPPVNQTARVNGLDRYADINEHGVLGVTNRYTFRHPTPEAIEAYQNLSCDIAKEIFDITKDLNFDSLQPENKTYILKRIADYYRTQIIALPFNTVNNSILMMQTNYFLNRVGLPEIPHRAYDFEATRLQPEQWRERFLQILKNENSLSSEI